MSQTESLYCEGGCGVCVRQMEQGAVCERSAGSMAVGVDVRCKVCAALSRSVERQCAPCFGKVALARDLCRAGGRHRPITLRSHSWPRN